MKRAKVSIPWEEGLHLRPATKLVKSALSFQSTISLKSNGRTADARSILAVLLLCATLGSVLELEASGADEDQALAAITSVFESDSFDKLEETEPAGDLDDEER